MSDVVLGTVEKQIEVEEQRKEVAVKKYLLDLQKAIASDRFNETGEGVLLMKLGYEPYLAKLNSFLDDTDTRHRGKTLQDKNFIKLLCSDNKVLAVSVMSSIISAMGGKSVTAVTISKRIARDIHRISLLDKLKANNPKLHAYLGTAFRKASKKRRQILLSKHLEFLKDPDLELKMESTYTRIGSTLLYLFAESGSNIITITKGRYKGGSSKPGYKIQLTTEAQELIVKYTTRGTMLQSVNLLPMVVPPIPWTNFREGGFLTYPIDFVMSKSRKVGKALKNKDLSKTMNMVNKIQDVSWRINPDMLDLVQTIFTNNIIDPSSPAKAPRLYGGLPTSEVYNATDFIQEADYPDWAHYNRAREKQQILLDAESSRRLSLVMTLDVAHTVKDYEKIWFVYQVDYRGRVYPKVNFLNPQGLSYVKSMLEFGEGKQLTADGVYWLKIHIANVFGMDKLEYADRIKWVDSNREEILTVASAPLENKALWVHCDSPFEYVAACKAYKNHIEGELVHLPIQLDATCSGIQFYSGIMLDKEGANAVNVTGNTRNDIYQMVADKVNKYLSDGDYPHSIEYKDSEGKVSIINTTTEAKSLTGRITRNMVKRNTMTVPYSVTIRGMQDQIWDILDEAELSGKIFWKGDKWIVNKLMTALNHRAIYEVVKGARLGQEYLKDISNVLDEPALWYTPLYNFPVFQPAFKVKKTEVKTPIGSLRLNVFTDEINRRQQSNKIAPNFIHSLDSTLLAYVVDNIGVGIGVIHDCFLIHPNDGYKVQDNYRKGFVAIMECNPLEGIGQQLDPEGTVEQPERGTLNLDDVLKAQYIIS